MYAQRDREKQTSSRDAYAHTMNRNISGHWNGHSEQKRSDRSIDVPIHVHSVIITVAEQ